MVIKNFKDEFYDIIIDDGLHTVESQINTFKLYFPKLKKQGIYVIEDVSNIVPEFQMLHESYTLYDLNFQRNMTDNRLIVYKK